MKKVLFVLLSAFVLSSCASIIHGSRQDVYFSSQPSGAKIMIDGKHYGNTPNTVNLHRRGRLKGEGSEKKSYKVSIELNGFYSYEMKINRKADGWFFGNIFIGGLIGIIIDAASGAMYQLKPDQVVAQLKESKTIVQKTDSGIYVAVTLTPDPSWNKIGQLKRVMD